MNKKNSIKKIFIILITLFTVGFLFRVWIGGSQSEVELRRYHMDVPEQYTTYALEEGVVFKQYFIPNAKYIYGIEVLLNNLTVESKGALTVELHNNEGDLIEQKKVLLSEIKAGQYTDILWGETKVEPQKEEYQIWLLVEGLENGLTPYLLVAADTDDLDQNSVCYYNDELIPNNAGSMMGFIYGEDGEVINWLIMSLVKSVVILLTGFSTIYFLLEFRMPSKEEISKILYDYKIWIQYLTIFSFIAIFCICALIGKASERYSIPFWVITVLAVTVLLFVWTCFAYKKTNKEIQGTEFKKFDKGELIVALVCIISRVPMFGTLQKWDAGIYYGGIYGAAVGFDFSLSSIVNNFRLAGHPSFVYTLFATMGELLFPGQEIGVHIVNLCLTVTAMLCIYRMFCNYWCKMPEYMATMSTVFLSLFPVYWGTFSQVNIDYPLMIFFVFLLYAEYKKRRIMMAFWTLGLLLSKETGWFIVAGFYIAYVLKLWLAKKKESLGERIQRICTDTMIRLMVIGIIFAGLFLLKQGGLSTWGNADRTWIAQKEVVEQYGADVAAFYFYPPYVLHKLVQIFTLNFMWIPTLIIIVALIIKLVKKKRGEQTEKFVGLSGILGGFAAFLLFSILYLTHAISRYLMVGACVVGILSMVLFWQEIAPILKKQKSIIAIGLLIGLMIIQNFVYIDPVSNLIFDKKDSGKGILLSANLNIPRADTFSNSYRFAYIDPLLNSMLEEAEYDSQMQIVRFHNKKEQSFINGFGGYVLEWDVVRKERDFACKENKQTNPNLIPINVIMFEDVEKNGTQDLAEEILIYFMPIFDIDQEESLAAFSRDYNIGEKKTVSNWGGTLDYYILTRKG